MYCVNNSWSADFRYVLALETDVNGRLSRVNEPCTIGVIDTKDGNKFIPVAETRAWNFQEAAIGHWLVDLVSGDAKLIVPISAVRGKWMSTEGYYDKSRLRNWVLMRREDEATIPVGSFAVPEAYSSDWRCDLHARWRPDGKQPGFNSCHEGTRQIYVVDLEF